MKKLCAVAFAGLFIGGTAIAGCWLPGWGGNVPRRAMVAGRDTNGAPLYVCKSRMMGSVQVGKVRPGINGCNIAYGSRVYTKRRYRVYVANDRVCFRKRGR